MESFFSSLKIERTAGAAGLQIEDQVFPKMCGHFEGKEVVKSSLAERLKSLMEVHPIYVLKAGDERPADQGTWTPGIGYCDRACCGHLCR
jgi:hypothetical protein